MIAGGKLTRAKLERFVRIRNKADIHTTMQFGFDAYEAGFNLSELGPGLVQEAGWEGSGLHRTVWQTPFGDLIEEPDRSIRLTGD